eukprot:365362-Chlamydomonas_euryale.AAC.9
MAGRVLRGATAQPPLCDATAKPRLRDATAKPPPAPREGVRRQRHSGPGQPRLAGRAAGDHHVCTTALALLKQGLSSAEVLCLPAVRSCAAKNGCSRVKLDRRRRDLSQTWRGRCRCRVVQPATYLPLEASSSGVLFCRACLRCCAALGAQRAATALHKESSFFWRCRTAGVLGNEHRQLAACRSAPLRRTDPRVLGHAAAASCGRASEARRLAGVRIAPTPGTQADLSVAPQWPRLDPFPCQASPHSVGKRAAVASCARTGNCVAPAESRIAEVGRGRSAGARRLSCARRAACVPARCQAPGRPGIMRARALSVGPSKAQPSGHGDPERIFCSLQPEVVGQPAGLWHASGMRAAAPNRHAYRPTNFRQS